MKNIFKTFETFVKEPLSIIKENLIQIVSLQTGNIFEKRPAIEFNFLKKGAQLTVVNNEGMYNLITLATRRAKLKKESEDKSEST